MTLCLNTTARGCELKGLQWSDVDLFERTLTVRKSKTAAGVRAISSDGRCLLCIGKATGAG
jgi:integrase